MSCDFGPIPLPHSPLQDYFDRKYRRGSGDTSSPTSPIVSSPLSGPSIDEHFTKALADLAKKQAAEAPEDISSDHIDSKSADARTGVSDQDQRRGSLATASGYAAALVLGRIKRRSVTASSPPNGVTSRQP